MGTLILIVLVFAAIRVVTDVPHLVAGTRPAPGTFEERYVAHPVVAYAHILPGVLYLLGAPLQLWRRFRERHFRLHRALGRAVLVAGLLSGVFALAFGIPFSFGGPVQAAATAVFAGWFAVALTAAYAAIRRRDIRMHRRWMIRAFAVGLGVGTIRIWIALLSGVGPMSMADSFAPAFWLGLSIHVAAGEAWLLWRPEADGRTRAARARAAA